MSAITSVHVSEEYFLKLTETLELGKYIALIDYRIRFDELPLPPQGQIISYMSDYLSGVFQPTSAGNVLFGAVDNASRLSIPNSTRAPPNPAPTWLRFLANGVPYPNVVVEVAVNNEGPQKLQDDCHRYFSNTISICIWTDIKVWLAGRKFWVGRGDCSLTRNRALIHTNMRFPPHHHPINTPVNLIYYIPMPTVYGNAVPIPPNSPATLDIDCDEIHDIIQEFL